MNYAINNAPTNLPDIKSLKERFDRIHKEHFDLFFNVSQNLQGSAKDLFIKQLEELRGR